MPNRLVLLALLAIAAGAHAQGPATARRHMAATANPRATEAALSALREGGSAVDAAIAAQMVLAVVEPQSSGLGGGSVMLSYARADRSFVYYDGLATAPAALPDDWSHDGEADLVALKRSGRLVGVPGTLRMLAAAHARQGRLPWPRLFRDAIAAAEGGFAMPAYLHATLASLPLIATLPDFAVYFDADRRPLPVGATVRNPALAATLRRVAEGGADAFYLGPIADDLVAAVDAPPHAGVMTLADLAAYRPATGAPACATVFGHLACSAAPPDSGGIAVLEQLGLLERLFIADAQPGSAAAAHLLLEASRLATADRRAYAGAPDAREVPVLLNQGLLAPAYLDGRAALASPDRAMGRVAPGAPPPRRASLPETDGTVPATTHVSIVDDEGNAVAFTTTINLNFGAAIVVDGIVLNDSMTNFSRRPVVDGVRVPNGAAPGKRPASTMAPTMVMGPDGPMLVVGAGGGARIVDSVVQTIVGVLAWRMDVRTAIEQPRVGAQTGEQELERGTQAAVLADALAAMGHHPRVAAMNAGVQAIAVGPAGLSGWADAHRDGEAMGD